MQGIGILLELATFLFDYHLFRTVSEEDIGRNMRSLKKYEWFQDYLKNEEYRELIYYDKKVRRLVGSFRTKKLDQDIYRQRCHERLERLLMKRLQKIAD